MEYGLQLYSVRDIADKDMATALKEVAAMGYRFVEFAGFGGLKAEEIRALLDQYHLEVSGCHTGVDAIQPATLEATIAYYKVIGCHNCIIPYANPDTKEKMDEFAALVKSVAKRLAADGIQLHYHNHAHEMIPTADGFVVHDELAKRTDLLFEIDTFWAAAAGRDPIAVLENLQRRVQVIHLKDGITETKEGRSLGEGNAPVKEVREYCIRHGIPMVVESEGLNPDGLSEVRRCIEFLKALDKQENR